MHPPRFRLRTLMVAVAVVGLVLAGEMMRWRSVVFRTRADALATFYLMPADLAPPRRPGDWQPSMMSRDQARAEAKRVERLGRWVAWQTSMRAKYERAARYPWL